MDDGESVWATLARAAGITGVDTVVDTCPPGRSNVMWLSGAVVVGAGFAIYVARRTPDWNLEEVRQRMRERAAEKEAAKSARRTQRDRDADEDAPP
jgi:hypothetical protein